MDRELVIIGAGVSGLGFAHMAAQQGLSPLLLEATDRVGGAVHSHGFARSGGAYWVELGAHTCFNSYGTLLEILESLRLLDTLCPKRNLPYRLLADGRLISVPLAISVLPLLVSLPRILWLRRRDCSIEEFFGGVVGRKNYAQAIGPALDALTCQPASELPADAVFVGKPRRKDIMRDFTGPQGLSSLIAPIAEQPGLELRLHTAVTQIEPLADGYRISLGDGGRLTAQTLVLAVDAATAGQLLLSVAGEIAAICSAIGVARIDSLAVMFEGRESLVGPIGGIIGRADRFYSAASRDGVADERHRAFTFHFRPGLDPRRRLERARAVLGLRSAAVADHAEKANILPTLRKGHAGRVAAIDHGLAGGRLGLIGNYFRAMGIEDCLCRARDEFHRLYPSA